jgi:endonuclease/exonuclease/phosphatase family metal-dependent hydrolase
MSFRTILLLLGLCGLLLGFYTWATGHKELRKTGIVAFYNVENLFDTLDDPHKSDNEFLPSSALKWNGERYANKQKHLAQVLTALEEEGMVMIGLAEVEHKQVVTDLLNNSSLSGKHYGCIHEESKDPRGIDVALIHSPLFKPLYHKLINPCEEKECLETRGILAVKGLLQGDTVWVFVNHWPSRRTGVESSQEKRLLLSRVLRHAVDSVMLKSPSSKIIVMGDFNDTPQDLSIRSLLKDSPLFDPFDAMKTVEVGSLKYKKDWFVYDQIILSLNWKQDKKGSKLLYQVNSAEVYHPLYLHYKEDAKNGPFRSYKGKTYYGGYSDHFPVCIGYTY